MSYDNTNTGIISKNDRKTTDKHPDLKGSINIDGTEYWLSGWRKTRNSDGAPFYSLRAERKLGKDAESLGPAPKAEKQPPKRFDDMDNDIPF